VTGWVLQYWQDDEWHNQILFSKYDKTAKAKAHESLKEVECLKPFLPWRLRETVYSKNELSRKI
jgi:hypothetical protein